MKGAAECVAETKGCSKDADFICFYHMVLTFTYSDKMGRVISSKSAARKLTI
jgi:hypothetical protein